MYEEREKLIKELDAFCAHRCHDLKSPLAVIYGYSLFLKEDYGQLSADSGERIDRHPGPNQREMSNIVTNY